MTELNIPDGLPSLDIGDHMYGEGKACVMEYVSVLAGVGWSDTPSCTNEAIAYAAQTLNDNLADADRHRLVPFIDRLLAAGEDSSRVDEAMYRLLGPWARNKTYSPWDLSSEMDKRTGKGGQRTFDPENWSYETLAVVGHYNPDAGIAFMDEILTAYEKAVEKQPNPVSPEALAKAKALIENGMIINV